MSEQPIVTVIIPAYNAADTIGNSIQSVLSQSYTDIELLIIDDASQDNIDEALKAFSDPRLTVIKHAMNQGAASARNTGIASARGEYIAFLDSDDIWHEEKLKTQISFLEKNKNTGIRACCTSFVMRRMNGHKTDHTLKTSKDWVQEIQGGCNVSPGSTLMAEKALFDISDIGLYAQDLRRLEDWDWLLRYIYAYQLGIIEEVTAEICVTGYPKYTVVVQSADNLKDKQEMNVFKHFGDKGRKIFLAGLEIEKAGTAFRQNMYFTALIHFLIASFQAPMRIAKLIKRIIRKIINSDY